MADQEKVIIPVEVKTDGVEQTLNGLKTKLQELTKQWGYVTIGSEAFKNLKKEIDETNKSIKATGAEIDANGNIITKLQGNIFKLIPGMSSLSEATHALGETFREIATSPLLGTLTAVAGAAFIVYEAFTSTKTGAKDVAIIGRQFSDVWKEVEEILGAIGVVIAEVLMPVIQGLIEIISSVIKALVDNKDLLVDLSSVLIVGAGAWAAYTIATSGAAIELAGAAIATGVMTAAQWALNVAMDANPIGLIIAGITALVAVVVIAYQKSEIFRGIVEGVIQIFKDWFRVGNDVIDMLAGIGKAIVGIITLDPAKIKEGLEQAAKAGRDIGKTFQEGSERGKKEISDKSKPGESGYDSKTEEERKAQLDKDRKNLVVEESAVQAKIAKLRMDAQKGIKGSEEAAKKAEEDYNAKVLKNRQDTVDYYQKKDSYFKEDKQATQDLRDATVELNNTKKQGYMDELRINRASSKLNKTKKEDVNKERAALDKALKDSVQALMNADQVAINAAKENSVDYYKAQKKMAIDELDFYKKNKDKFKMADVDYNKKKLELEKKVNDNNIKIEKVESELRKRKVKAEDEAAVAEAKTEQDKYNSKKKQLEDDRDLELNNKELTEEEKVAIVAKYKVKLDALDEDKKKQEYDLEKTKLDNIVAEDELKKSQIEKEVVNTQDKFDRLRAIEEKEYQDKVDRLTAVYNEEIRIAELTGKDTTEITARYNFNKRKLDFDTAEQSKKLSTTVKEVRVQEFQVVGQAAEALGSLLGEQTAAGKALAISSALISTYLGVTRALEAESTLPSPFDVIAKVANVAAVLGTGLSAVKKITAVQVPGGGGGSQGAGSISTPTTTFQAPQLFGIGGTKINDPSQLQKTTKVFVTEQDITRQQNRVSQVRRASIQGG